MSQPKKQHSAMVHFVAGGLGGSFGAFVTCPLEVIQTRLQSSAFRLQRTANLHVNRNISSSGPAANLSTASVANSKLNVAANRFKGVFSYGRYMVQHEGFFSLYKGLGPTLLGVTPSRAIYFALYSTTKDILNKSGTLAADSSLVYMASAAMASFVNHTVTNPLWFVKTRLQLDNRDAQRVSTFQIVRDAYKSEGIRAFYRGLSASYVGISETVVHFTIYEKVKGRLLKFQHKTQRDLNVIECMLSAGVSKSIAASLCYPHEVARTRLRQQESDFLGKHKYNSFLQTLKTVIREEGWRGLYGGLGTHLIRQVPNTAIMFFTYEGVVYFLE
ncbi:solute carrier family 25 member 36-A-like [Stylophora pistillata]|uniref:solute carrier family 25 member 36-A-like n=1 Tax=Stylophora pistillata TaxID=50429 RepID=UPI000C045A43|nr:solute carrier family 25 member 36-A-like [Stylophora pistillata]